MAAGGVSLVAIRFPFLLKMSVISNKLPDRGDRMETKLYSCVIDIFTFSNP